MSARVQVSEEERKFNLFKADLQNKELRLAKRAKIAHQRHNSGYYFQKFQEHKESQAYQQTRRGPAGASRIVGLLTKQ